jgi:hypothetical protein
MTTVNTTAAAIRDIDMRRSDGTLPLMPSGRQALLSTAVHHVESCPLNANCLFYILTAGDPSLIKENKMKMLRVTLACTLLLLVAFPTFAAPCGTCSTVFEQTCDPTPGSQTRCRFHIEGCQTISALSCSPFTDIEAQPAMLAEWTVTSIEINRPAERTNIVTSPAAVAEAPASQTALQN